MQTQTSVVIDRKYESINREICTFLNPILLGVSLKLFYFLAMKSSICFVSVFIAVVSASPLDNDAAVKGSGRGPLQIDPSFGLKLRQSLNDAKARLANQTDPLSMDPVFLDIYEPFMNKEIPVTVKYENIRIFGLSSLKFQGIYVEKTVKNNVVIQMDFSKGGDHFKLQSTGVASWFNIFCNNSQQMSSSFQAEGEDRRLPLYSFDVYYDMNTETHSVIFEGTDESIFDLTLESNDLLVLNNIRDKSVDKINIEVEKSTVEAITKVLNNMDLKPLKPMFEKFLGTENH